MWNTLDVRRTYAALAGVAAVVVLVAILPSCKARIPACNVRERVSATVIETLRYRAIHNSTAFDHVLRELLRIQCVGEEHQEWMVGRPIDDIFPLAALSDVRRSGCGFFETPKGHVLAKAFRAGSRN